MWFLENSKQHRNKKDDDPHLMPCEWMRENNASIIESLILVVDHQSSSIFPMHKGEKNEPPSPLFITLSAINVNH